MKWIIIPLAKIIILLVALVVIILICIWEGSLKELKKLNKKPFQDGRDEWGTAYTFPTLKDWLLDRKHYPNGGN